MDKTAFGRSERTRMYVGGQPLEIWENPDVAFGTTEEDLQKFMDQGSWVALFNAVMLASNAGSSS
jgi:hypothetical protein